MLKRRSTLADIDTSDVLIDTLSQGPPEPACECAVVDILALETPEARDQLALLPARHLKLAFAMINVAMFRSGLRCRKVRFQRYSETYTPLYGCNSKYIMENELNANNPYLVNLRSQYDVDGIILIAACLDFPGLAWPGLNVQKPYAAVRLSNLLGPRFSLAHEFGHLVGAQHNRKSNGGDVDDTDWKDAHGWHIEADGDGVMQWSLLAFEPGPNTRLVNYSNPGVLFNGVPTGTPHDNNAFQVNVGTCSMADNESTPPNDLTIVLNGETMLCTEEGGYLPHRFSVFVHSPSPGPGSGPFAYEWRWSPNMFSASNPGTLIGSNSPELIFPAPPTCIGNFYLKIKVTSVSYGISREAVIVVNPANCSNCPDVVSNSSPVTVKNNSGGLFLFPNPSTGMVAVRFNLPPADESAQVQVLSVNGSLIWEWTIQNLKNNIGQTTLDLQTLPAGSYLVRMVSSSGISTQPLTLTN